MKLILSSNVFGIVYLKLSYLFVMGLFFLDVLYYSGFVANNLISPFIILGIITLSHLALRLKGGQVLGDDFARLNILYLAPIFLLLSLFAYFLEEFGLLFPNYFFTNFRLHYLGLPLLVLPALGLGAMHASGAFWRNFWQHLVFMFTTFLIIGPDFFSTTTKYFTSH